MTIHVYPGSTEAAAVARGGNADEIAPFRHLLDRLAAEGESPESGYEQLRRRLIAYFRLHLPAQADELADACLDRLARKIAEGTCVQRPQLYALGIARMVLLEVGTRMAREKRMLDDPTLFAPAGFADSEADTDTDTGVAAVSACLERLPDASRAFILAYYACDGVARIHARQQLATEQGISINALRNRALRLRETLERCVHSRLQGSAAGDESIDSRTQVVVTPKRNDR